MTTRNCAKVHDGTLECTSLSQVLIASVFCLHINPAYAEMTANQALRGLKTGDASTYAYFAGVSQGLGWANTTVATNLKRPLFCEPDNSATNDADKAILKSYLVRHSDSRDYPLGLVLLAAFTETYACK